MLKKFLTVSFFLAFFASMLTAQSSAILRPNGEKILLKKAKNLKEAILETKIKTLDGKEAVNAFAKPVFETNGTLDTLSYDDLGIYNVNFGFFGQDVMMQYFEAPADLIIQAAGFTVSDETGAANAQVSLRLVKLNWTLDQLTSVPAPLYMGFYPSDGDGFNNADFFGEEATGPWGDSTGGAYPLPPWADNANPDDNTFDYDLWSDGGFGWVVTPVASPFDGKVFQWVEMSNLFTPDTIKRGEVFAVVLKHEGVTLDGDRIGFWSDNTVGYPGWKYYENGRFTADQPGWWVRKYTWDFAVAVDLVGDRPPVISNVTKLLTTLSTDPRTVEATITDDNPSGGDAGVAGAVILVSTDTGATWSEYQMTNTGGDNWSGEIPGQQPGTFVMYKIQATDVGGLSSTTQPISYFIYQPSGAATVKIFNGQDGQGYPEEYYFGHDDFNDFTAIDFPADVWAYGPFDNTLIDNYQHVYEFATLGPAYYHRDVISAWLAADPARTYFLAGQEWLGADNGFTDQDYTAGSFEYDVFGITHSYNDVSYDGTAGQELPSLLFAQEGTVLGGALYDLFQANGPTDSLTYDPVFELSGAINNWIDAFEVDTTGNAEVFLTVETRGIAGVPAVEVKPCGVSNITANGNKVAFMSLDPIAINSRPDYYWYGFSMTSPQSQSLEWFGIITGVEDEEGVPERFTLSQNYPNPFNPSTVIKYSLPEKSNVSIKVYDMLGQEVATLVNEVKNAGTYQVNFDASGLTSGMYIYKIQAGDYVSSKKMMLLK